MYDGEMKDARTWLKINPCPVDEASGQQCTWYHLPFPVACMHGAASAVTEGHTELGAQEAVFHAGKRLSSSSKSIKEV